MICDVWFPFKINARLVNSTNCGSFFASIRKILFFFGCTFNDEEDDDAAVVNVDDEEDAEAAFGDCFFVAFAFAMALKSLIFVVARHVSKL